VVALVDQVEESGWPGRGTHNRDLGSNGPMKRDGNATWQGAGRGRHGLWREFPAFDPFGRRCCLGVRGPQASAPKIQPAGCGPAVGRTHGCFCSTPGRASAAARLERRNESTDPDVAGEFRRSEEVLQIASGEV
jgi:hypothetical protein